MSMLLIDAYEEFHHSWALVTAGSMEDHNSMTVSWGGVGSLWGKSVATVYIRPNRHTYGYFEKNEYFTVSFYPEEYKNALGVMGSKSGRDCDKDAEAGLTAIPCGETVTYAEARRTLLCRKLFAQDMKTENFTPEVIRKFYGSEPAHKLYIGEIIDIIEG